MHTDASGSAVAATLGQVHDGKVERPVAFASQKLSGSQLGWAIIVKEAYAIIWALNRLCMVPILLCFVTTIHCSISVSLQRKVPSC